MRKEITVTWLGHSCFRIRFNDYRIIIDPYKDGSVPGFKLPMQTANDAFCSHNHDDHGYLEAISCISTEHAEPFMLEVIDSYHDDQKGFLRGRNKIHLFTFKETKLAHFGDLGEPLTTKQKELLGQVDIIMVPVGGHYTINAQQACQLARDVKAKIIIPMHYKSDTFGHSVLDTIDAFLACAPQKVIRYDVNQVTITDDTEAQVMVLKYLEEEIPDVGEIEIFEE